MRKTGTDSTEDRNGNILYDIAKSLFGFLFSVIYPIRYINNGNLMYVSAPYILMSNHNSSLDPLILIRLCPGRIRFLVKKELERNRFLAWCIKKISCVSVDRDETDVHAFKKCVEVLKSRHILGIFPEGTRYSGGRMENPKTGAALMALMQKVDILPVYIDGRPRLFRRTDVIVGEPVFARDFSAEKITAESINALSECIREKYESLRDELAVRWSKH